MPEDARQNGVKFYFIYVGVDGIFTEVVVIADVEQDL